MLALPWFHPEWEIVLFLEVWYWNSLCIITTLTTVSGPVVWVCINYMAGALRLLSVFTLNPEGPCALALAAWRIAV